MSTRREARVCVMQALYAHELAGGEPHHHVETILRNRLEEEETSLGFATRLFEQTIERQAEIDALIDKHLQNWEPDRIALIDRALLRMGTCELLTFEDIPPKVTVDEVIEVSKSFSTDQSGSFVNGVLDAVLIDLQRQGRLQKSGRGLVGIESIRERDGS